MSATLHSVRAVLFQISAPPQASVLICEAVATIKVNCLYSQPIQAIHFMPLKQPVEPWKYESIVLLYTYTMIKEQKKMVGGVPWQC